MREHPTAIRGVGGSPKENVSKRFLLQYGSCLCAVGVAQDPEELGQRCSWSGPLCERLDFHNTTQPVPMALSAPRARLGSVIPRHNCGPGLRTAIVTIKIEQGTMKVH
jgi:hypothetical protein